MLRSTSSKLAGVSGMAVFAPPARVDLKEWCQWTGNNYEKVSAVVGTSFRVPTRNENAYTMAATAVLRLIENNNIDPDSVGFLGLGTESSTDNSAGAVIVRGMVDRALEQQGKKRLSRHMEVPEFKHACLGGIYALKSACRYVAADGAADGRTAIVVASDIAEYAQGSSGEQTQGAGAVAMFVENKAQLFDLDLSKCGSASAYRGPDFRKPVKRHFMEEYSKGANGKITDFPVFSGPYSTVAYLDEVTQAVEQMVAKSGKAHSEFYNGLDSIFFHRPYHMMPVQSMAHLLARGLAYNPEANKELLDRLLAKAKVTLEQVRAELDQSPDFFSWIEAGKEPADVSKATSALAKALRGDKYFAEFQASKMGMGQSTIGSFGNLYTGSLPCWLACGFDEAAKKGLDIAGKPMAIVGYGSGDASEAIPMTPVAGWEVAAKKIKIDEALANPLNLTKEAYAGLHSGAETSDICADRRAGSFVIDRTGTRNEPAFQDIGIDYFKYVQ